MEGIILKGIGGFYYIKVSDNIIECKARGKFRYESLKPMVGDRVKINMVNGKGTIEEILPRTSTLIRPTVSNVTQAFVVFAIKKPDINYDLLNRFLVLCEYNNIKSIVCLNKRDLCTEQEREEVRKTITNIGYEVLFINAKEKQGIDELQERLKNNISVFCGPSGVGKSTLLNALINKKHMETGEISEKLGRGKHTTRHSELIEIEDGFLVDTPGFSTLGLDFIDKDDLKYCFPEFENYNDSCKFKRCNHYKEPNCAVKKNVEENNINRLRYEFYVKTLEEIMNRRVTKW